LKKKKREREREREKQRIQQRSLFSRPPLVSSFFFSSFPSISRELSRRLHEQKTDDTTFSPKRERKYLRQKQKYKKYKIRTQSLNTSSSISTKSIPIANSPKVNRHKRTCILGVFETESPIRAEKEIRRRSRENMLLRVYVVCYDLFFFFILQPLVEACV